MSNIAVALDIDRIRQNVSNDKLIIYKILKKQIKNTNPNQNHFSEYLSVCKKLKADNIDLKNVYCKIYELLFELDGQLDIYKIYLKWLEKNDLNMLINILIADYSNFDIIDILINSDIGNYILTILIDYNLSDTLCSLQECEAVSDIITKKYTPDRTSLFQLICRNYISTEITIDNMKILLDWYHKNNRVNEIIEMRNCTKSILHTICRYQTNIKIIKFIIKWFEDNNYKAQLRTLINVKGTCGSIFHELCISCINIDILKYLIDYCEINNYHDSIQLLFKNIKRWGTPLHIVCQVPIRDRIHRNIIDKQDIFIDLLMEYYKKYDISIYSINSKGNTPFHNICNLCNEYIIHVLNYYKDILNKVIIPNNKGLTPIQFIMNSRWRIPSKFDDKIIKKIIKYICKFNNENKMEIINRILEGETHSTNKLSEEILDILNNIINTNSKSA